MLPYLVEPPTRKALKSRFLDGYRASHPHDTLNCVAHLIVAIDEPEELSRVALEFMVNKLSACRGDMGFMCGPADVRYDPFAVYYNGASAPPVCEGTVYPNRAAVFQETWRRRFPVASADIASDPLMEDSRAVFEAIESKSILFQRLTMGREPLGMICIDFTHDHHCWTAAEMSFVGDFCNRFLAPLAGISRYWHAGEIRPLNRPSVAELEAIRLAACGLSAKQIAGRLGKSVRTVENQLRNARLTLDAANRSELIARCRYWL